MKNLNKTDIGLIGLAVMGKNLALNMVDKGWQVSVYNRTVPEVGESVVERFMNGRARGKRIQGYMDMVLFVESIATPHKIMMMVRAGSAVDGLMGRLFPLLSPRDILTDRGNSNYEDTNRRVALAEEKDFRFVGAGVLDGEEDALNGASIMPGGSVSAWEGVRPVLQSITAKTSNGAPCCQWVGPVGSGHFVKMIHNSIEYSDMQLISEAYWLMKNLLRPGNEEMSPVFSYWNEGKLRSYLIEITANTLQRKDESGGFLIDRILDVAGQKGTGKWSVVNAMELGMPLGLIATAVFERSLSARKNLREATSRHFVYRHTDMVYNKSEMVKDICSALYASKLVSYAQGFTVLRRASGVFGWQLNLASIACMWRGGCIIRSVFLNDIAAAFKQNEKPQHLLLAPYFSSEMKQLLPGWKHLVAQAMKEELPVPAFSSTLNYFYSLVFVKLLANMIQAQHDYFDAHTFKRIDELRGQFFHEDWTGHGGDTKSGTYNVQPFLMGLSGMPSNIDKAMNRFVMTIFGASGDLTKRKLMPALCTLYKEKHLPESFAVLGVGHTEYQDDTYRAYTSPELERFVAPEEYAPECMEGFCKRLHYLSPNPADVADYGKLNVRLQELTDEQEPDDILYYLITPPSLYGMIPLHLKAAHLSRPHMRIIVEKLFGYDLESARELNRIYASVFEEQQIYCIDHFLGKETVQSTLTFRFANGIFEPLWNRNYIDYVEITAVENLGIGRRRRFYEGVGALWDMVQNHLIQLVALTAMEPPTVFNADNFRNEVVKVYESLSPLTGEGLKEHIVRGQYTASATKLGYREERSVAPDSRTKTYIVIKIGISNWRQSGVPFYIRMGKQTPTKVTEIVVHFRETPHQMFRCEGGHYPRANKLILRSQPNEGIVLKFGMKVPRPGFDVKQVMMDFSYSDLGGLPAGDAHIRLIEDCIQGDQTLFTCSDAVDASQRFFNPVLKYWQEHPDASLHGYPVGTQGPLESEATMNEHGAEWTNPCKNLANTGEYCEL